ncbi:MAG: hypothetical protein ACE368_06385, partial [Paracoccaceae bacterium]
MILGDAVQGHEADVVPVTRGFARPTKGAFASPAGQGMQGLHGRVRTDLSRSQGAMYLTMNRFNA